MPATTPPAIVRRPSVAWRRWPCLAFLVASLSLLASCSRDPYAPATRLVLWHQMMVGERQILAEKIAEFEQNHPGVRVEALYKETEELRSGFQAAALAGIGPDLIYGPSDAIGAFATMNLLADLQPWFQPDELSQFVDQAVIRDPAHAMAQDAPVLQLGDRLGNHLALVINRQLIPQAPRTTAELVAAAIANTIDRNGDGKPEIYGLVWNFTEPFFLIPFLTGYGGWVFQPNAATTPALDASGNVAAIEFVHRLQSVERVLPQNCDYETADALFKNGQAAMIINGDWSWAEYLANPKIDAAVCVLPEVSETGLPMQPMVATKGYSLNRNTSGEQARQAIELVRFLLSEPVQADFSRRLKVLPSRKKLLDAPELQSDPTLKASYAQALRGRSMPVVSELRAVWDAMRPSYQLVLSGKLPASQAAQEMQADALKRIAVMNSPPQPDASAPFLYLLPLALLGLLLWWQRGFWSQLRDDWQRNPLAYWLALPAFVVTFATIIYPFLFNLAVSCSNMSLRHFHDWRITGVQNYFEVFREPAFFRVALLTLLWTVVNVTLHVAIGVLLAVTLNGPVRGKSVYRLILILPWAIPAYITALSWRGMFDAEYGAVNLLGNRLFGLPAINWLGDATNAFLACLITNVWLGFPFMMVIALGGLQGIPAELYEAARMERVSRWQQFWQITLPLLRPVLVPAATLGAIWTFNNLNVVWLVSNGGEPADQTHILVSYVYKSVFNAYRYGFGAALSVVIFAALLVLCGWYLTRSRAVEGATE